MRLRCSLCPAEINLQGGLALDVRPGPGFPTVVLVTLNLANGWMVSQPRAGPMAARNAHAFIATCPACLRSQVAPPPKVEPVPALPEGEPHGP